MQNVYYNNRYITKCMKYICCAELFIDFVFFHVHDLNLIYPQKNKGRKKQQNSTETEKEVKRRKGDELREYVHAHPNTQNNRFHYSLFNNCVIEINSN